MVNQNEGCKNAAEHSEVTGVLQRTEAQQRTRR